MATRLTPGAWAAWGEFLRRWFSLRELRQLAFDLGAGFEVFSTSTRESCALALVRSLEHARQLGCLVDEVQRLVPGVSLPPLSPLPPCVPRRLVAISLAVDWPSISVSGLQREVADAFRVPVEQVTWMAAAGDQVRLLVSLPGDAVAHPAEDALGRGRYGSGTISAWEQLSRPNRRRWRVLARRWPPSIDSDRLRPAVPWASVRTSVGNREAWLVVVVGLILVVAGAWAHRRLAPLLSSLWHRSSLVGSHIVQESALWLQFLGSLALSALALSWLTAFWFSLGTLLLYGISRLPRLDPRMYPSASIREWPRHTEGHDRLIGTALNLLSNACSLALLPQVTRRPLDYWDLGIQALIAALIQLVVLGVLPR